MRSQVSSRKLELKFARTASGVTALLALAACGGGASSSDSSSNDTPVDQDDDNISPSVPEVTTRGQVIDGYISGARVYRDVNSNGIRDAGEPVSMTDTNGNFTLRDDNPAYRLVADHNNYSAIDTSTGLPINITLSAPSNYQVISPLSSVILQIVEQGNSLNFAENAVKGTLSIASNVDLALYDPIDVFTTSGYSNAVAEGVLLANLKLANILILSDDDDSTENANLTSQTIANLADVILEKYANNAQIDLSNVNTLLDILPASTLSVNTIASINSNDGYLDALDDQISSFVGNLKAGAVIDQSQTTMLLAFDLGENFDRDHAFKVELTSSNGSTKIESLELVAIAGQFAVFKFSTADVVSLGPGAVSTKILDENLDSYIDERNDFNISNTGFEDRGTVSIYTDSGVVADGYISNARVFRDENENNAYDAGEQFVLTNSSGEFTGLGGTATKPIVADGNDGAAVDTSTGVTFNAVLAAPAGSKVVNPITTIVNELLQDDASGASTVAEANQLVANTFGLTNALAGGALVDFTKFDAISGTIYNDDATESTLDVGFEDMVTATQGVATYVANLVVAGANEQGGDVSAIASTTRSILSNIKDLVKSNQSSPINFTDDAVILSALGSNFNSNSTTLEKMKTDFTGFDPVSDPGNSDFSQDKLVEKQLVAQSEFGDGVLTTAEASNGALLVVGPTYDPAAPGTELAYDGKATVKITNEETSKVIYKSVTFSSSKYASVEISASELNDTLGGGELLAEVKPGELSGSTWAAGGNRIFDNSEDMLYFHKGITPEINFDSTTIVTALSNGAAVVSSLDTSFTISGTLEIDVGDLDLPGTITLRHLVDGLDTSFDDGTGRYVTLEFIDSFGDVKFVMKAEVDPTSGVIPGTSNGNTTAQTGASEFTWTTGSFSSSKESTLDSGVTFADLADGSYSIRASFIDAYGAVSNASDSTFSNLIIDRVPPQVSGQIVATDTVINAAEGTAEFTVNLTQTAASFDGEEIVLVVSGTDKILADEITAGNASASFNSTNTALIISYTPTSTGTVDLEISAGAFLDATGNKSTSTSATSLSDGNQIAFDFVAPTVAISALNGTGLLNPASDTLNLPSETDLKLKFVFSEEVESFSVEDDVTVSQISGANAASIVKLSGSAETTDNITWYADLDLASGLTGDLTVNVASNSYADTYGNLGSSGTVTYSQDTASPAVFQLGLKTGTEKATYGFGDAISIIVTFDSDVASITGSPVIELTIGGQTRSASFVEIDGSDASKVLFSYDVTKASGDRSDDDGIGVASAITGGTIVGVDGNPASLDLTTASQPLDLSGKVVDAGTDGSAVDGYVEGAIIYADNDASGDLSSGDPIAQANATGGFAIYGAAGPLVLEGGFDISTNKDFNVRYKAPGDATITYTVINPITTLIDQVNSGSLATAEQSVRLAMGSPLSSDAELRSYNAYEAIAEAGDGAANTDAVAAVVADALKYQQVAASTALVVDFISSASYLAQGSPNTASIQAISDDIFTIIGSNLSTFMSLFVGKSFASFYDDSGNLKTIDNNVTTISSGLDTLFGSVAGFDVVQTDFSEVLDVLATAIAAINSVSFTAPSNSTDADEILTTAEDGINALTEIVQVQTVLQTNMLSDLSNYYPDKATSPNITVSEFLGTSESDGFPSTPVGTVVPIRYSIEAPSTKSSGTVNDTQFEADENGLAAEFEFTITRSGSIKTNSQLNYEIIGTISESDIVGGIMNGELFFDVNEKTKTLKIAVNNDDVREAAETLTVFISDPSGTSQIVEERASVTLKDDDPSTPEISLQRASYSTSEDGEVFIDDASVDYFDQDAYFSVSWQVDGGSLSTTVDGSAYTQGTFVSFYDLQTDLLRNLQFDADAQSLTSDSGAALVTVTAAENSDGSGRTSSSDLSLAFDVGRKPSVDISGVSFDADTSFAGVPMSITGITISDPDSEYITATVSSSISGEISTTSSASYSQIGGSAGSVSFAGDLNSVRDALSKLTFKADKAGDVKFTVSVDDGDTLHARDAATGALVDTATQTRLSTSVSEETSSHTIKASSPVLTQVYEPNVKVGSGFWNGFTGINVSDIDSANVTVVVTSALDADNGNAPKVNFRFYDNTNPSTPLTIAKANGFTVTGSSEYVTDQLKLLQVEMLVNEDDLITYSVYDGDAVSSDDPIDLVPSYLAMDNAVPDPGGNLESDQSINEDGGSSPVSFSGLRLYDSDAFDEGVLVSPTSVRILSSTGGEVYTSAGASVRDADGLPIDIAISGDEALNLRFDPEKNFNGTATINYVVVDPQQSTFTSPISELSVEVTSVNDAPKLSVSTAPAIYVQGQPPATVFSNVSVTDVDSSRFSEVLISSDLDTNKLDLPLISPDGLFGLTKTVTGNSVVYSGATLSASDVSSLLTNIKFQSSSNNLVGETRTVNLSVKDALGLESTSVSKTIELIDVNDAPKLSGGVTSAGFTEGQASDISLSSFGSISDPEGNNISKFVANIAAGYKVNQDFFTSNISSSDVSVNFDAAGGSISIVANSEMGISADALNTFLSSVGYTNTNQNPGSNSDKLINFEITDIQGETSISSPVDIQITPVNDLPVVFNLVAGSEVSESSGPQYVGGGGPVRAAPTVRIRDVDNSNFMSAEISITSANGGVLDLSTGGEKLAQALGVTVSGLDSRTLSIFKTSPTDNNYITTSNLQSILREVSYNIPTYDSDTSNIEGLTGVVTFSVIDAAGGVSSLYTSKLKLLDEPSVDIKQISIPSDTNFATTTDKTADVANVLTFNSSFSANQVLVDLSASKIYTDVGRFNYDPSITALKLPFNQAGHADLSALSGVTGVTETKVIGQSDGVGGSDVIYGSAYDDFIDGNGGLDLIRAGAGDDAIPLRLDTDGTVLDGEAGSDTIILSQAFSGSLDLGSAVSGSLTVTSAGNSITLSNFENIDGRSTSGDLTLKGDLNNDNLLLGGAGDDVIWLRGGTDIASGADGADTYVIDLSSVSTSGVALLDITSEDKIKFVNGTDTYLSTSDLNWIYGGTASEMTAAANEAATNDVWIAVQDGNYQINVETSSGLKSIDIGSEIFGAPGKWIHADGSDFTLQPEQNIRPKFDTTKLGPLTSPNKPVLLSGTSGDYSLTLSSGNILQVIDTDDDPLSLTVDFSGGTVMLDSSPISSGFKKTFDTPAALNTALSTLKITGTESGQGTLSLSITDTYSDLIGRKIYFKVPNSAPTIAVTNFDPGSPPSTLINAPISLDDAGVAISIDDVDTTFDIDGKLLEVIVNVDGATATYSGVYSQFVQVSGGQIIISHDGTTALQGSVKWPDVLEAVLGELEFSNPTVGRAEISVLVSDGKGLSDDLGVNPILIDFEARPLEKPLLFAATDNLSELNASQFDTGKVRIFLQDKGARVGDKLVIKTTIADVSQTDVTLTIPASTINPDVVAPYIDIPLSDLVSGSNVDGTFVISAELHIDDAKASETSESVSFDVDTQGATTPKIVGLNDAITGAEITSEDVTALTVLNSDAEEGLSHSLVRIFAPQDGAWYDFNSSFDLKELLLGSGKYLGEIAPITETYDDLEQHYNLTFSQSLADGVYAVISRDSVGNASAFDASSFDFENEVLPDGLFVVDQTLSNEALVFDFTNATPVPGESYKLYEFSGLQAKSVALAIQGTGISGEIQEDIVKITIQAWDTEAARNTTPLSPNIEATFTRSLTATESHWLLSSGSNVEVSTNSSKLKPIFDIKILDGLPGISGNISTRLIVEDLAGNEVSLDSQPGQILLDVTADVEDADAVNGGFVTSLVDAEDFHGVSLPDATSIDVSIIGLDSDVEARSTFFLTTAQIEANLKYTADGLDYTGGFGALEIDETLFTTDANQQLPQFSIGANAGAVYLDINDAFVNSLILKDTVDTKPETPGSVEDWKYINTANGKAEYIAASAYNKYIRDPDYVPDVYVSTFVVNTHVNGQDLTTLDTFSQNISAMMPAENSPDQPLFIVNKVTDRAGNVSFRDGILEETELNKDAVSSLSIDVTRPVITSFTIDSLDDTGALSNDLVTSATRVGIEFSADEEIASARLVQISHLSAVVDEGTPLATYDLALTETPEDDGATYTAKIIPDAGLLNHGLWAIEVTDMAGNPTLADASALKGEGDVYNTNVNFKTGEKGLFVVDTLSPPDANIAVEHVEVEGGYINQYESDVSLSIAVLPGYDDASPEVKSEDQIATIRTVTLNGDALTAGSVPDGMASGTEVFNFDATLLQEGEHVIAVTTEDLAGNTTITNYKFIKDTISPVDPVSVLELEGAGDLMSAEPVDGVLNRVEVGYDTSTKEVQFDIDLLDLVGTRIVSVKVNDFEVEGVPFYALTKDQFGTHTAGNYIIEELETDVYQAFQVQGEGTGAAPFSVSSTPIALSDMDADAYNLLPVPARSSAVPISALGGDDNPSLSGVYHFNPMDVIAPDHNHEAGHTLTIVVADLAGNLTTVTSDFEVDTRLPIEPNILVERAKTNTSELELSFWETIETFNGVQGVRVKFKEAEFGDFVLSETVQINGAPTTIVDEAARIFFIDRTDLVNKGGLESLGTVEFGEAEAKASYGIYELSSTSHGVSSNGNFILIGDDSLGWEAHAVTGDGTVGDPFVANITPDDGTLTISGEDIFGQVNTLEVQVSDASGNLNTFTETFATILDQPKDQYFSITPTAFTRGDGAEQADYLRLDVYLSEQALNEVKELSEFQGTAIDLKMTLPSNVFTMDRQDVTLISSDIFTMSEADYDPVTDIVRWSGLTDTVLSKYNAPVLSIDAKLSSFDEIRDLTGDVKFTISKISDRDVTTHMDLFSLEYGLDLSDLILTPYELTI